MAKKTTKKVTAKKVATTISSDKKKTQPQIDMSSRETEFAVNFIKEEPFYQVVGCEEKLFLSAVYHHNHRTGAPAPLPVIFKGPTGCGKTRFLEYMAYKLERPLITVSGHEDLSKDDLVGRAVLDGLEGKWRDGPLLTAAKIGAIFYLDEMVEARSDTTVAIHPATDHRREVPVEALNKIYRAHPEFVFTASYNPGYQSVQKGLKPSTQQRFVSITMSYPSASLEAEILNKETGLDLERAKGLVEVATSIRALKTETGLLEEGPGTRLLVYAASLIQSAKDAKINLSVQEALYATLRDSVTDAVDGDAYQKIEEGIGDVIQAYFGE